MVQMKTEHYYLCEDRLCCIKLYSTFQVHITRRQPTVYDWKCKVKKCFIIAHMVTCWCSHKLTISLFLLLSTRYFWYLANSVCDIFLPIRMFTLCMHITVHVLHLCCDLECKNYSRSGDKLDKLITKLKKSLCCRVDDGWCI